MTEQVHKISIRVAESIDRRRFLRRTVGSIFATATALSVGRWLSPAGAASGYPSACLTSGTCPYGCGPSRCCNSQSGACDCSAPAAGCKSGTTNCHGKDNGGWNTTNCWTCDYYRCVSHNQYHIITTCCDCSTSGCDENNRCISYQTLTYHIGACGLSGRRPTAPELVGVQTGDPSTSWGFNPMRRSG